MLEQILILVILILLSAFFSGVETALMSLNMAKVNSLLKRKKKGAETLHRLKQNPHKLIITILIGNNLVNIGAASFATLVFTDLFGSSGVGIATGIMTFLILVFGEITPKTFATQNAERISLKVARPIEVLSYILSPLVKIFEAISRLMSKLLGSKKEKQLSEEELSAIVTMGLKEGILNREAARMMQNILKFEGTKVTEIMTPRTAIEMLDGNKTLKQVLDFVVKSPFSRYPVYLKSKKKAIGFVDVDNILKQVKNNKLETKIKKFIQPIYLISEKKEIDDLLTEFEKKKIQLAVVVTKSGNVCGLVTVEDILEEIVGDIFDKSRKTEKVYIKRVSSKLIRVDARASIEEINKELHLGLEEKHFKTIAGFVNHKIKTPKKGAQIKLKNVTIEIDKVENKKVRYIKIIKL